MDMKKQGYGGKAGDMVPGKQAVGNKIITNRGYGGGVSDQELIGAKKINGPK